MQYKTQIPHQPAPTGIIFVKTDPRHAPLQVELPAGGRPGDIILFHLPDNYNNNNNSSNNNKHSTTTVEPILATLEKRPPTLLYRIGCCCCLWCCPSGQVVVSEWTLAFIVGLWIGLSLMFGFALGTLSVREEPEPEL